MKSEQVKVNFTFLILALLEYETVSISFVTIIIINILVQLEYHFFSCIIHSNLFTVNYFDRFF